jgi:hypothetical protein
MGLTIGRLFSHYFKGGWRYWQRFHTTGPGKRIFPGTIGTILFRFFCPGTCLRHYVKPFPYLSHWNGTGGKNGFEKRTPKTI